MRQALLVTSFDRAVDVSVYAGTSVTLRLTAVEDTGATTSFVVDDVTVNTT